jgi:ParB/Sulfiredoxin domain
VWVNIGHIKVSGKQARKVDPYKVEHHRQLFEQGGEVMPIDVVKINNAEYNICGNGRHRYFGALKAGLTMIEVNVLNE